MNQIGKRAALPSPLLPRRRGRVAAAPFRFMVPMHAKNRKKAFHEPEYKKASSPQPSPPEEEREKTRGAGSWAQCTKLFFQEV
jgi:hypothetical protein